MSKISTAEAIKEQIANLVADRERMDRAIEGLQVALRNVEGATASQSWLTIDIKAADTTLNDAVKRACMNMVDGITRQRVLTHIEREHPFLKPKSPSVAAALINLSRGDHPLLRVAIEGKGRSPSFYSTHGDTKHTLSTEESKELLDPATTRGTGGWQSLFVSLQRSLDRGAGVISLTPEQRARVYHYYWSYGGGGWQERVKRIFRRELPQLFVS